MLRRQSLSQASHDKLVSMKLISKYLLVITTIKSKNIHTLHIDLTSFMAMDVKCNPHDYIVLFMSKMRVILLARDVIDYNPKVYMVF